MKQTRKNRFSVAEKATKVKDTKVKDMSKHNNLKGTRTHNYINRSKPIRNGTGSSCGPKEMVMKSQ